MGLDLRLYRQHEVGAEFSRDIIELEQDYTLFSHLKKLSEFKGQRPQKNIRSWFPKDDNSGDWQWLELTEDAYGDKIVFLYSDDLKKAIDFYSTDSWKNTLFIESLNKTPKNLLFGLYWH